MKHKLRKSGVRRQPPILAIASHIRVFSSKQLHHAAFGDSMVSNADEGEVEAATGADEMDLSPRKNNKRLRFLSIMAPKRSSVSNSWIKPSNVAASPTAKSSSRARFVSETFCLLALISCSLTLAESTDFAFEASE